MEGTWNNSWVLLQGKQIKRKFVYLCDQQLKSLDGGNAHVSIQANWESREVVQNHYFDEDRDFSSDIHE